MKIILLKTVPKVGKAEDIVEVSKGFARNSLFPKKLAVPVSSTTLAELHRKQSSRSAEQAVRMTLLEKALDELAGKSVIFTVNANEKGNLFSKIDSNDVAAYLLKEQRLAIDPKCIILPESQIKKIGTYKVQLKEKNFSRTFTMEISKK